MIYRSILLLIFIVISSAASAAPLQKVFVRNAAGRQAVCNDGTPAVYYMREGTGGGSNNWVIFLSGGGLCYSVRSCNERRLEFPELMTSRGLPSTFDVDGILSDTPRENPDFFNANHVAIPYCSSDLWSGDRERSRATGNHEFRGFRILRAVVSDLRNRPGRKLTSANRILLSGTSAGGIGVMVHLDWLAAQFPRAEVRGFNDAGWTPARALELPVPVEAFPVQQALRLWNGKPDQSCAQASSNARFLCYSSAVYPHLNTPLMVQMSQHDTVFLAGLGVRFPFNSSERVLANLFAAAVRDSLSDVPAAFSPRTNTHGILPFNRFTGLKVNGFSLHQLLGNWFFHRAGPVKQIKR